jgi:hypothetical protein
MTDPLSLDPVLPVAERSTGRLEFQPGMSDDERFARYEAHVHGGGKVEATDCTPTAS